MGSASKLLEKVILAAALAGYTADEMKDVILLPDGDIDRALARLEKEGIIRITSGGEIIITEQGRSVAERARNDLEDIARKALQDPKLIEEIAPYIGVLPYSLTVTIDPADLIMRWRGGEGASRGE